MKRLRRILAAVAVVALFAGAGLALRHWGVGTMRVLGASMNPTLQNGDVVLVLRASYAAGGEPRRGDVVECAFPGREGTYIKRVVGLPGEQVAFSGGALYVDGALIEEGYVSGVTEDYSILLQQDQYLVLGDNRPESYDSRMSDMGPVRGQDLRGRVVFTLWPLGRLGTVH